MVWGIKKPTSGYITFDGIRLDNGTKVFHHELQALRQVTDVKFVIAREWPTADVPFIKFELEKWYPFNPFLADYFVAQLVPPEYYGVDILHMACSPGLAILSTVRPKHYVVHIIAHDLKSSIEEHIKYYGPDGYQLIHNTDPYLHRLLLKHADGADAIVTASTPAEKWIRANTGAKKVIPIPHGADIPETVASLPDKFTVGYLGTFGPDKGLPYLLIAWRGFQRPSSELVFGGNCCKAFEVRNIHDAFLTGIERFRLLGWLPSISDFFNNISVYVQPSVTEGFGIEIPEAMAYGRPVIVTSTTGGQDLVTDGVDGFVVPPRNPQAILDKIGYFADNPSKITEMGNAGREKISRHYKWEDIEQMYVKFYKEILQ